MAVVQVARREGEIERVPRGQQPLLELHLTHDQRIVSVEMKRRSWDDLERKTVDWYWVAYVETRR